MKDIVEEGTWDGNL